MRHGETGGSLVAGPDTLHRRPLCDDLRSPMTSPAKMHPDELDIDAAPVGRLVREQFPQWAGLAVTRVASAGTENAMFRLGDDMVVRLPRRPDGARQIKKEHRWMPHLAPCPPLAAWGVHRWLEGDDAYNKPLQ